MPDLVHPDAGVVVLDGVAVSSSGLAGAVRVHWPGTAEMRGAERPSPAFVDALEEARVDEQLTVEITDLVDLTAGGAERAGGEDQALIRLTVPGPGSGMGQLLLAADEDGVLTWHMPEDIPSAEVATRGSDKRTYVVSTRVVGEPAGGSRGVLGSLGKKLLKILAFRLIDPVLGRVGDHFMSRWEAEHRPHRLRPFWPDNYARFDVPALGSDDLVQLSAGPALLFVHGTSSLTHSGFGRLPKSEVEKLYARYRGRVFAFDHPTMSVTPTDNARWLASQLPAGAGLTVDVVSHSRGGLVTRVLCERPKDAGLDLTTLRVRTAVMVAAPNAGTALADRQHLGTLVDTLTNLLELIPDNPVTDPLAVVLTLLKQLAVGAMGGLDGLMAMTPRGAWLRTLNRPSPATTTYRAIAADYEPGKRTALARFFRDAVLDRVFGAPNDLIVPTAGSWQANGASGFPIQDPLVFTGKEAVDHSSYWVAEPTLRAFDRWLPG